MISENKDSQLQNDDSSMQRQLQFTELIMNLSTSFINLPINEVDNAVRESLAKISQFVKADQSFIIYYDFYKRQALIDYEWCNVGFSSRMEHFQSIPMEKMDNWIDKHLKGEIVYVYDIDSYDQINVKNSVSSYGIKSVIAIPMMDNNICIGYVSFDSIKQNHSYSEIEKELFKVFVQLLVNLYKRKLSTAELRESELKYRLLFEDNPEPMFVVGMDDFKIIEINNAAIEHYGYSKEELLHMTVKDFRSSDDLDDYEMNVQSIINQSRSKVTTRHYRKNGELIHVEITSVHIKWNEKEAIHMLISDITEKVNALYRLQQKKDTLNNLLHKSSEFIYSDIESLDFKKISDLMQEISGSAMVALNIYENNDKEYTIKSFSGYGDFAKNSENMLGYNLLEKKWAKPNYSASEDANEVKTIKFDSVDKFKEKLLMPKPIVDLIHRYYNIGNITIIFISYSEKRIGCFVLFYNKGVIYKNSEIIEMFANQIGMFLTRMEFEKSLFASEEKYRYLFENNPQPMMIYNIDSLAFLKVNNAAISLYGFSHEEFLRMTLFDICPPDEIPELVNALSKIRGTNINHCKRNHLLKNGDVIHVELSSTPIQFEGYNARHVLIQQLKKVD
ncbi:hypothetical protein MASR2M117_12410 [Paludibacter sp.]